MKKTVYFLSLYLFVVSYAMAADYQYGKLSGFMGTLTEKSGWDCCKDGKERMVKFPVIELYQPINVGPANPSSPELDEIPEHGVTVIQLSLSTPELWKSYKMYKGKKARVTCELFHAINGHHMTPVLCMVSDISQPN